jgi:hypothetical protein
VFNTDSPDVVVANPASHSGNPGLESGIKDSDG